MKTINDIRREAEALEFNIQIDEEERLNLVKRSDPRIFYHSLQPVSDQRMLHDAWSWLQNHRKFLRDIDQARSQERAGPRRHNPAARIFHLVCFLLMFEGWLSVASIYAHIPSPAFVVFTIGACLITAALAWPKK